MDYLFKNIKENIYVLAIWDIEWKSFNNCYFINGEEGVTLIDSCRKVHTKYVEKALGELGKSPEDVNLFLATHGHEDHIEGSVLFKNAKKYIHSNDSDLVESHGIMQFNHNLTALEEFDYSLVGYHTAGSVVYYHRPSKIIFTGDYLCFFGDPLSKDGLVSEGNDLRNEWLKYLRDGGVSKDYLEDFLEGLNKINQFENNVMCTGHGGVLVGNITDFVNDLIEFGIQYGKTVNRG